MCNQLHLQLHHGNLVSALSSDLPLLLSTLLGTLIPLVKPILSVLLPTGRVFLPLHLAVSFSLRRRLSGGRCD